MIETAAERRSWVHLNMDYVQEEHAALVAKIKEWGDRMKACGAFDSAAKAERTVDELIYLAHRGLGEHAQDLVEDIA